MFCPRWDVNTVAGADQRGLAIAICVATMTVYKHDVFVEFSVVMKPSLFSFEGDNVIPLLDLSFFGEVGEDSTTTVFESDWIDLRI